MFSKVYWNEHIAFPDEAAQLMDDPTKTYESLGRKLCSDYGSLQRLSFLNRFPYFDFVLHFEHKDVYVGQRHGEYDIDFLTFGYSGEGPRYLTAFLSVCGWPVSQDDVCGFREGTTVSLDSDGESMTATNSGWRDTPPMSLMQAVQQRDIDRLESLMGLRFSANTCDGRGVTPLHIASEQTDLSSMALLIEHGSDVQAATTEWGYQPIHICGRKRSADTDSAVEILVNGGAKLTAISRDGDPPLCTAALHGNLELARSLITRGANPNACGNDFGETNIGTGFPLHSAITAEDIAMIRLLRDFGAELVPSSEHFVKRFGFVRQIQERFVSTPMPGQARLSLQERDALFEALGVEPPPPDTSLEDLEND